MGSPPARLSDEAGIGGLVGLILVIAILAVLATMASSSGILRGPALPDLAGLEEEARGQKPAGASAAEAASRAACRANYRLVEDAMARKQAVDGSPATSIEALQAGGWLSDSFAPAGDVFVIEATDDHQAARLLVNGTPDVDGCTRRS